uniref:Uncharacterized protein n=1 Tax=viral metagenome TaxID=1070528 RepID=A0A6C0HF35_9ZZZZ
MLKINSYNPKQYFLTNMVNTYICTIMFKPISSLDDYEPLDIKIDPTSVTLSGSYNGQNIYIDFPRTKQIDWTEKPFELDDDGVYVGRFQFSVWLNYQTMTSKIVYNIKNIHYMIDTYTINIPFITGMNILSYGYGLQKNMGLSIF